MNNSETLPDWIMYVAQDADGTWWGYSAEPHLNDSGWYENEVGKYIRLDKTDANIDWQNSLKLAK